jgi:hypothetical protein
MTRRAEDALQEAIYSYLLTVLPTAAIWSTPNEGKRSPATAAALKRRGMLAGACDLNIVVGGRYYGLEVKARRGNRRGVVSPLQWAFADMLELAGAPMAIVESIDDVRAALKAWKIPTREVGP